MKRIKNYRIPAQKIPIFEYELSVERKGKKEYYYELTKEGKREFYTTHQKSPLSQNPTSNIVRGIVKVMSGNITVKTSDDINAEVNDENIKKKVMDALFFLDQSLEAYNTNRDELEKEEAKKNKEIRYNELTEKAEEFMDFLIDNETNLMSFLWYVSQWLTGAEAKNTIIGFICHVSTYLKIAPVWFFAHGRAGEGKSFIDDHTHKMLPVDAVMNGRITNSALHRKTMTHGEDFLDGKILVMRDLGSKKEIEKWEDTLHAYKELTTEGKSEFELTSESVNPDTGEREPVLFVVKGKPSVSLTTVHSEAFDEQIMRRGVSVAPEASEEEVRKFHYYNKGVVADKRSEIIDNELGLFYHYIDSIKEFHDDVEVINPYWTCLEAWFKGSEFYKANLTLYPALVESVTLLNYYYRETIVVGDKTYLISTREDNRMVADLFNPTQGISESAIRIFNLLTKWYEPYDFRELDEYQEKGLNIKDCDTIFSTSVIKNKAYKIKALKGLPIGDILSTLVSHGFIEVVGKMNRGNNNVYCLSHFAKIDYKKIVFDNDKIAKYVDDLSWMYKVSSHTLLKMVKNENVDNGGEYSFGSLEQPPWILEVPQMVPQEYRKVPHEPSKVPMSTSKDNKNKVPPSTAKNEKTTKEVENENT